MVKLRLDNVTKRFGRTVAVSGMSVEVEHGELFTFLGPSGCGKSTTLRLIAGFELPDEGKIFFDDEDVTLKKPYERGTAMVFQNYALWPHMTVYDNIAYGLKLRKLPKNEIKRKVKEALEMVKLPGYEDRYPTQLSGGEQQRVALARALVVEPKILLLDEPLSNLDAKLRLEMREEIRRLQRELGVTTIYVTHDQEEAMSISDRIAVMNKGRLMQVGTPHEIYYKPRNIFVASFIGRSTVLQGRVLRIEEDVAEVLVGNLRLRGIVMGDEAMRPGGEAMIVIRPEFFEKEAPREPYNTIKGRVALSMFMGVFNQVRIEDGGVGLTAYLEPEDTPPLGSELTLYIPINKVYVYAASQALLPYKTGM